MSEQIRRMRLPTSTLTWGPEHDGIIGSYVREMAGIHGVIIENDQTNMLVLTGVIDVEDSGQALIVQIDDDDPMVNALRGKRVRVTVEVID